MKSCSKQIAISTNNPTKLELMDGRKKIVDEKSAQIAPQTTLQNQIEAMQEKLEKLRKNSQLRENELKKCSNFDRRAMFFQRRLDQLRKTSKDRSYGEDTTKALQQRLDKLVLAACSNAQSESDKDDNSVSAGRKGRLNEAQRLAEDILRSRISSRTKTSLADQRNHLIDVALLRKRLDSLSMSMNESKEYAANLSMSMNESKEDAANILKEYRYMPSSSGNSSSRRTHTTGNSSSRRTHTTGRAEQKASQENKICSERCKATIRKILEQVQAETEQWSQVQEIVHHVQQEMEDLQKSRDFWEDHACRADEKAAALQVMMHEWRGKARLSEIKVAELQSQAAQLRNEIEQVRQRHAVKQARWLDACSRHTGELLSSNSARSSIGVSHRDLDSLNHEEAFIISGAEMSNRSANREKADHPSEDENLNQKNETLTKYTKIVKPRISKAVQKSHICSQQPSSMHLRQKDYVAEQLSQKRNKKRIEAVHSRENFPSQDKHRNINRSNINQGSMGSDKSCCSSIRSPLADIGNASPLSSDHSSGLDSVYVEVLSNRFKLDKH